MYRGPQQITVLKRGLAQLLRRDGFGYRLRRRRRGRGVNSHILYYPWGGKTLMGR